MQTFVISSYQQYMCARRHTEMSTAAWLVIVNKCPPTGEWLNKLVCLYHICLPVSLPIPSVKLHRKGFCSFLLYSQCLEQCPAWVSTWLDLKTNTEWKEQVPFMQYIIYKDLKTQNNSIFCFWKAFEMILGIYHQFGLNELINILKKKKVYFLVKV